MVISVDDFKTKFTQIFGDEIWDDFIVYGRRKQDTKSFNSIHDVIKQLNKYKKKIANRNLYTEGKSRRFARFALISIEKAFRHHSRTIIFNEKEELSNGNFNRSWEVEHIFPQSKFDTTLKKINRRSTLLNKRLNKHSLNNLTLITRELNGKEKYKVANFQTKKRLIKQSKENEGLYINRIFKNQSAKSAKDYFRLLLKRQYKLKFNFNKIFKPDEIGIPVVFFRDVLGYSESDIKTMLHITHLIRKWCKKRRRLK